MVWTGIKITAGPLWLQDLGFGMPMMMLTTTRTEQTQAKRVVNMASKTILGRICASLEALAKLRRCVLLLLGGQQLEQLPLHVGMMFQIDSGYFLRQFANPGHGFNICHNKLVCTTLTLSMVRCRPHHAKLTQMLS